MDIKQEALNMHSKLRGKIEITARCPVSNAHELTLAYTPGVAEPCLKIAEDPELSYTYTRRWNSVAVISDGTAVLGLGDIGPEAALPVMEGKCVLFKSFAGVDAYPLVLNTKDPDEIVRTVQILEPGFGGINLEDIAAPRCFEIERRLKESCSIPIFHDDQHGTAIVVLAALLNALKIVGKPIEKIKVAVSGGGAAACAVSRLLLNARVSHLTMSDIGGVIYRGRADLDPNLLDMANLTNPDNISGTLRDIVRGADVFIGLSAPNLLNAADIATMNQDAICFSLANPTPEIMPEEAVRGGARVVGSGRSDYPNQINNVLAFPGLFRGALNVRARTINEEMKLAAAAALAALVSDEQISRESILPPAFDPTVAPAVAKAVAEAARKSGAARC